MNKLNFLIVNLLPEIMSLCIKYPFNFFKDCLAGDFIKYVAFQIYKIFFSMIQYLFYIILFAFRVESVLFLSLYIIYVLFMFINHRVEVWLNSLHCLSRFGPRSHELEAGITYHALPNLSPGQFDTATNKLLTSSSSGM